MQAFMLYMSGGGVQIFSMGIVAMLLLSPFKNVSAMNDGASPTFALTPYVFFFPFCSRSHIFLFGFMLCVIIAAVAVAA